MVMREVGEQTTALYVARFEPRFKDGSLAYVSPPAIAWLEETDVSPVHSRNSCGMPDL
jgi:hypothetical protein